MTTDEAEYGYAFSGHHITSKDDTGDNDDNTERRDPNDPFPQARASQAHMCSTEQTASKTFQ